MRDGLGAVCGRGAQGVRRGLVALAAGSALAVCASPGAAIAATPHSLTLTGPSTATVGQPIVLQAAGTVSDDPSVFLPRRVNVYALPASLVSGCPDTYQNAIQISYATSGKGGDTVAMAVPVDGAFSVPIAYTATVPGRFWLCGYLHEGVGNDATASHIVDVSAAGASPGPVASKPASLRAPKVSRSGRALTCRRGSWSGSPTRFTYSWRVDGKRKKGAAKARLRITRSLKGRQVQCAVRAVNAAGTTTKLSARVRVR